MEAEGNEEDRAQERIGDPFETVADLLHEFAACNLFLEEQAREISAEDDVEADGFRNQPVCEPQHQHEREAVPVPIAERMLEQREPAEVAWTNAGPVFFVYCAPADDR